MNTPLTTHHGEYDPWLELKNEPYASELKAVRESGGFSFRSGVVDMSRIYAGHPTIYRDDCIVLIRGPDRPAGQSVPFD